LKYFLFLRFLHQLGLARSERVATIIGDMDGTNSLPNDLSECQQLLLAAYKQSVQLEQHAEEAERRAAESDQQAAELNRVLDETAASFEGLKQEHAATLDELAWFKRWAFGRRRERVREGEGQGHLFDLDPPATNELEDSATLDEEAETEVKSHRRRKKRQIDWDQLRQIHHEHDLSDEEKVCSCCGRTMERIGEDVTRELEYEPPKLEAHIHTRPKYACRRCQDGVWAAPLPARPIPGGIAGPGLVTEVIVGKFGDHLPLYRLEDIVPFGRHSGPLRRIRFPKHDVRLGEVRGRTSLAALRPAT
jgi:transposase